MNATECVLAYGSYDIMKVKAELQNVIAYFYGVTTVLYNIGFDTKKTGVGNLVDIERTRIDILCPKHMVQ